MKRGFLAGSLLLAALTLLSRMPRVVDRPRRRWPAPAAPGRRAGLTMLMRAVSELGTPPWATASIALAAFLLALRRRRLEAVFVLATSTGPAVSLLLKVATRRERPTPGSGDPFLFRLDRYSFPSGHVVLFEVFYGFVAYLAIAGFEGALRWAVVAASLALILLVGPSRLFVGAHWRSDVAAGYLIGGLWLALLTATYRRAQRNLNRDG